MATINRERLKELTKKKLQGTISNEESEELDAWYNQPVAKVIEWNSGDRNERELKLRLYQQLLQAIGLLDDVVAAQPGYKLWPRLVGVAAAMTAIIFGIWFFNSGTSLEERAREIAAHNDVAPPAGSTTLTLANGHTITLSPAKDGIVIGSSGLKYTDSSKVTTPLSGEANMLSASTGHGKAYHFILPDGSKIWLNAASTLKFPSTFDKLNTRTVELRGEAYFEVAKNAKKPFIVKSRNQELRVLGTHFNISAYSDDNGIKTTLLEGSVHLAAILSSRAPVLSSRANAKDLDPSKVGMTMGREGVVLKPGQQSLVSASRPIAVKTVDTDEAIAWKNGDFIFNAEPLESILIKLSNWYGVQFIGKIPDVKMTGAIARKENLSKVLALIADSEKVKFKIERRKVYIEN